MAVSVQQAASAFGVKKTEQNLFIPSKVAAWKKAGLLTRQQQAKSAFHKFITLTTKGVA